MRHLPRKYAASVVLALSLAVAVPALAAGPPRPKRGSWSEPRPGRYASFYVNKDRTYVSRLKTEFSGDDGLTPSGPSCSVEPVKVIGRHRLYINTSGQRPNWQLGKPPVSGGIGSVKVQVKRGDELADGKLIMVFYPSGKFAKGILRSNLPDSCPIAFIAKPKS